MTFSNDPNEWLDITLYTIHRNPRWPELAWCIFKDPRDEQLMCGFGEWDSTVEPSPEGLVGHLTVRPFKTEDSHTYLEKIAEKRNKGYKESSSTLGFYINLRTHDVINLDYSPDWFLEIIKLQRSSDNSKAIQPRISQAFDAINESNGLSWF